MQQEVTVGAGAAAADWDLKLLPAQEDLRDRDAGSSPAAGRGDSGSPASGGSRETGSQRESSSGAHQHRDRVSAHGSERGACSEREQ